MTEFYIGQIFENTYPPEAAIWCNENNAFIDGVDNVYTIKENPEPLPPTHEEIREMRAKAFTEEADPLKYNYEEDCARFGPSSKEAIHSKLIWLEKKDEIRERYPYPVEE